MTKVGIITFHRAHNYGAVLQAYALYSTIKNISIDDSLNVSFVDNSPRYITNSYKPLPKINKNAIKNPLLYVKNILTYGLKKERYNKFNSFIEKMSMGSANTEDYDIVVCGSDQIWNPNITTGIDPFYYGGLSSKGQKPKKISYAASFGLNSLPIETRSEIAKNLKSFSSISVRESNGVDILNDELNIKGATHVVDPCLLLNGNDWKKIAKDVNINERYVFVYRMNDSIDLIKAASDYATKNNCKIIEISYGYKNRTKIISNHEIRLELGPEEFLGLIMNAEFVFTNSFHSTVFSVLFEKKFYSFSIGKISSRITSFLNSIGLENQYLESYSNSVNDIVVDYTKVNEKLKKLSKDSKLFLFENLRA